MGISGCKSCNCNKNEENNEINLKYDLKYLNLIYTF